MIYLTLKYIHILSSTLLLGTGLGTAFYGWIAQRSNDVRTAAIVGRSVVLADWIFTAPAVIVQPATGVALALSAGYPLASPWLVLSIVLYACVGAVWLPVVWLQIRLHRIAANALKAGAPLPALYYRYARIWLWLGGLVFLGVLAIFSLMIFKPEFPS